MDYTKQLNDIIKALNHPGPPYWQPWVLAAFSVFLGIIGGIIGRFLEPWISDFHTKRRLRRVLYADISRMVMVADFVSPPPAASGLQAVSQHLHESQIQYLKSGINFDNEAHLKSNPDVYLQLPEKVAADHIYLSLHELLDDPRPYKCSKVVWLAGLYLKQGFLLEKCFARFLGSERARRFVTKAREQDKGS